MDPEDYSDTIADLAPRRGTETIPVTTAIGRVTAGDVIAQTPMPAFATSAMDGFALDSAGLASVAAGIRVDVRGDIPAGHRPVPLRPGSAVRVMTGAQVPTGAEAVVPVECTDASPTGEVPSSIRVTELSDRLRPGWNIKAVGEDTEVGDTVIAAGARLSAAGIGTLVMLGHESVEVERPVRIGLIITGDELRSKPYAPASAALGEPASVVDDREPTPLIHNSNLPMLSAAVSAAGAVPIERSCGDDPAQLLDILGELSERVDLIITTGGISAGAYEVVRQGLEGGRSTFHHLALRPGGPQGHGRFDGVPLLHFPGTPAGAFLSFHLFAVSLLAARPLRERWRKAVFAGPELSGITKGVLLIPGGYTAGGGVVKTPRSRLRDYSGADVIIRIPRSTAEVCPGDIVDVLEC